MEDRSERRRGLERLRSIARLLAILGPIAFAASPGRPAAGAAIQIMPLGDSITWGYAGSQSPIDPGGYRGRLYSILAADGYTPQFVGSWAQNPPVGLPAAAQGQEGHIGDVIANSDATNQAINDHIADWLGPKGYQPDVVLLMIGTNNIIANHDLEAAPYQLGALIARIHELDPKAHIFASTLLPLFYSYWEGSVKDFNAKISGPDGVIAGLQKAGIPVSLVDIGNQLTQSDLNDGIHPSPAGYQKMANAWAAAIEGRTGPPGVTPEPATAWILAPGLVGWLAMRRGRRGVRAGRRGAAGLAIAVGLAFGPWSGTDAGAATIQIMPLGDSITWGYVGPGLPLDPGGYRGRLYTLLTNDGYDVQMVGSNVDNPPIGLPAAAWPQEGHPGNFIADRNASNGSINTYIANWLGPNIAQPDIVLLMIGTNNIFLNHEVQDAPYQVGALIARIHELDPKAKIFDATIPPNGDANQERLVQDFNAKLSGPDGVIAGLQKAGIPVSLVDVGGQLTLADLADGLHPMPEGYQKIAVAWADAIEGVPLPGVVPEPTTALVLAPALLGWLLLRGRRRRAGFAAAGLAAVATLGAVGGPTAGAAPLRIMPLGDSITYGFEGFGVPGDPGGYRGTLYRELIGAGYNPTFVGSETDNADPTLPAAAAGQEGHVGYVIEGPMPNGSPGLAENLTSWLGPNGPHPNLVLLMIGTNNESGGYRYMAAPYQLAALVSHITQLEPGARVLVSTLTPMSDPGAEARVRAYNQALDGPDGIVAQLQKLGEKVNLVHVGDVLSPADLIDGVHPTPAGYAKLGDAWFRAIEDYNAAVTPEPPAVACLLALAPIALAARHHRRQKGSA